MMFHQWGNSTTTFKILSFKFLFLLTTRAGSMNYEPQCLHKFKRCCIIQSDTSVNTLDSRISTKCIRTATSSIFDVNNQLTTFENYFSIKVFLGNPNVFNQLFRAEFAQISRLSICFKHCLQLSRRQTSNSSVTKQFYAVTSSIF